IRDPLVTGVQTCALPILSLYKNGRHKRKRKLSRQSPDCSRKPVFNEPFRKGTGAPVECRRWDWGLNSRASRTSARSKRSSREARSEERRVGKEGREGWVR